MYKVYWRAGSASFAVEALLEELREPYEKILIESNSGPQTPDWFRDRNPLGQVPVLEFPDGRVMSESAAMMIWLADAHPVANLAPAIDAPERPAYLRWMVYLATNVYISFRHMYHGDSYTPDDAQIAPMREMAKQSLLRDLEIVEEALDPGPYVLGDKFSAVDIYLGMFPDWHTDRRGLLSGLPRIAGLCDLVMARPAVARARLDHMGS
jgi:glutathione S-transferase